MVAVRQTVGLSDRDSSDTAISDSERGDLAPTGSSSTMSATRIGRASCPYGVGFDGVGVSPGQGDPAPAPTDEEHGTNAQSQRAATRQGAIWKGSSARGQRQDEWRRPPRPRHDARRRRSGRASNRGARLSNRSSPTPPSQAVSRLRGLRHGESAIGHRKRVGCVMYDPERIQTSLATQETATLSDRRRYHGDARRRRPRPSNGSRGWSTR